MIPLKERNMQLLRTEYLPSNGLLGLETTGTLPDNSFWIISSCFYFVQHQQFKKIWKKIGNETGNERKENFSWYLNRADTFRCFITITAATSSPRLTSITPRYIATPISGATLFHQSVTSFLYTVPDSYTTLLPPSPTLLPFLLSSLSHSLTHPLIHSYFPRPQQASTELWNSTKEFPYTPLMLPGHLYSLPFPTTSPLTPFTNVPSLPYPLFYLNLKLHHTFPIHPFSFPKPVPP